ncbi:hypothetical protein LTR85_010205 [Meristemomyces frigidus]|nr:hypothetical protein LTR85_010205 [Meristemomyces frigidus]
MAAQPVDLSVLAKHDAHADPSKKPDQYTTFTSPPESEDDFPLHDQEFSSNPFLDPKVAKQYRTIYESAQCESRHVFDPDLRWSKAEEKKLVRKLDWHVATWACIMFFALNLDRKNLKQAISDEMLPQLGLTTDNYNYGREGLVHLYWNTADSQRGNTIFYISFLLAELPSQLISKKLGPDRWIPMQMALWSIVAASQAALTGKASFYACRSLLGILEGGFIPDLVLWLSYFYKSGELSLRLSIFWIASDITAIVAAFMAYGLLQLEGVSGLAGWRLLFLIEGLITLVIGLLSFFLMPASAVQTKTWFRPNGWFFDREVAVVVNRVLRDNPSKGDMHNRMGITPGRLWAAVCDYDLWPIHLIGLVVYIPYSPPTQYLTLSLKHLGFSTLHVNLLTIPSTAATCFTLYGITWLSERLNERSLVASLQNIWVLPCLMAFRWWHGANTDRWSTYAVVTVMLSYPYCHAIVVSWASRNSGSVRTRSVSAAFYNMMVQTGNIVSSNIYRTDDAPLYHRGNSVLLALDFFAIALFAATKLYYTTRNRRRERVWDAMSEEQRAEYLDTTKHEGNKRLDFRFAH